MTDATALALVVVATLFVGAALPVLAQLFVTLRKVQRVAERVDQRTLTELEDAVARVRRLGEPSSDAASLIGAAVLPAALAAFRAVRAHLQEGAAAPASANGLTNDRTKGGHEAAQEVSS